MADTAFIFEAMRQDMHQQFEAVLRETGEINVHLAALVGRKGHAWEQRVRGVVEEFAGQTFPVAARLVLRDEAGEVFGVPGADVEFDLYAHNEVAYLVEVKSHLKPGDVLIFHKKVQFAQEKLGREVIPLIIALSMEPRAEQQMQSLGVQYRVRATVSD